MKGIWKTNSKESEFLRSSLAEQNSFQDLDTFKKWFSSRMDENHFEVNEIPLKSLDNWFFDQESGDLKHESGKFFSVEGLSIETNFGAVKNWEQPIINQPEIGVLGVLTKQFKGIRYFLMQVKMEPGNININQLSPTVQATQSNLTQVHGGKLPKYLEYFLERGRAVVLYDQLQSEQGARFLRKRNRNMIIEVLEDVPLYEDFCWLTLGELKQLLEIDNFVNMDARTVISCVPLIDAQMKAFGITAKVDELRSLKPFGRELDDFNRELFVSALVGDRHSLYTMDEAISWITELKTRYELNRSYVPLRNVRDWIQSETQISHSSGRFFSVIGVRVEASNREVVNWTQPLLKQNSRGLIGFLCQKINGVLHFVVQGKVEAGNFDSLEMAPTVSIAEVELRKFSADAPPFINYFLDDSIGQVRHKSIQSEEGGRFFHFQNSYMVVEVSEGERVELPDNYTWMTLRQIMEFMRYNNYFSIEARGLLSCLRVV